MKKLASVLLLSVVVLAFGSCEGGADPAGNANSNAGNANTAAKPAEDIKDAIVAAENKAYEAWKAKDKKFFEENLTEGFVGVGANGRLTRDAIANVIANNPCEVKSFENSDARVVDLGDGVAVMTGKTTSDVTCNGKPALSPSWVGAVFVKDGDTWKHAYHQTSPTADAKGDPPAAPSGDAPEGPKDTGGDATESLKKKEQSMWDAWAKKDTKAFDASLADNYQGISAAGQEDKASALKNIGGHKCEVKSQTIGDFIATKINDKYYLITYSGEVDGTCDGNPMPKKWWSTTVVSKDGDDWKGHFHMATPGA